MDGVDTYSAARSSMIRGIHARVNNTSEEHNHGPRIQLAIGPTWGIIKSLTSYRAVVHGLVSGSWPIHADLQYVPVRTEIRGQCR
jgi:hypothetical protein